MPREDCIEFHMGADGKLYPPIRLDDEARAFAIAMLISNHFDEFEGYRHELYDTLAKRWKDDVQDNVSGSIVFGV